MIAPPIDPGIQDRNSKFAMLLSFAKFDTLRSSEAAPASIVSKLINFVLEKFEPSLITAPLTPWSLISVFEPAPKIVVFKPYFLASIKNSMSWLLSLGLKKYSATPPRLNQL